MFFAEKRLFLPVFFALIQSKIEQNSTTTVGLEALHRAIQKFKLEFNVTPNHILTPLDCNLILAVQSNFPTESKNVSIQTSHFYYVKYLFKLANKYKLRNRKTANQLKEFVDHFKRIAFV